MLLHLHRYLKCDSASTCVSEGVTRAEEPGWTPGASTQKVWKYHCCSAACVGCIYTVQTLRKKIMRCCQRLSSLEGNSLYGDLFLGGTAWCCVFNLCLTFTDAETCCFSATSCLIFTDIAAAPTYTYKNPQLHPLLWL